MKVGMFVVRVIWPIKPRGGARRAPTSRRSRIDDRRGERAGREATTAEGAKGARGRKRWEAVHDVRRPRLAACSAHAWFRLSSCTLPVAARDGTADRPRLHRGRDTSSSRDALSVWRSCRLAARVSVFGARRERKGEREKKPRSCHSLSQC